MGPRGARTLLLALAAGLGTGCGLYSFSGSSLPSHIKTIAVPFFENGTLEPEVADQVTEAVTQRFIQNGRLNIVGESRADCVLEGRITSYENKVHNYSGDTPEDYIVVLRVSAKLRDSVKGRDLWQDENLTASAVYSVVSGVAAGPTDELTAREEAIDKLSEDILAHTMEQW
jgi:hypothetical protein